MSHENPYAPPASATTPGTPAGPAHGSPGAHLSLSALGWEVVSEMAKWMRMVSGLLYAWGVLLALGIIALLWASPDLGRLGGPFLAVLGGILALYALFLFLSGTWLRRAATKLYEGVVGDSATPLASGFRYLRLYLIFYALLQILKLVSTTVQLLIN